MSKTFNIIQHIYTHAEKVLYQKDSSCKEIKESKSNINEYIKEFREDQIVNFKFTFEENNFSGMSEKEIVDKLENVIKNLKEKEMNTSYSKERIQRIPIENIDVIEKFKEQKNIKIIKEEMVTEKYYNKERKLLKIKYIKDYERIAKFEKCFFAIHTKSFEEANGKKLYDVKPHIHIVFEKEKANLGNGYIGLKEEIIKVSNEHNLVCSLQKIEKDLNKNEEKELKILTNRISSFSWALSKNPDFFKNNKYGKYRNENCVNPENIERKLNRYIELGGSNSFAEKIKIKLKSHLNQDIVINKNEKEKIAEQNIENKRYINIIEDISLFASQNKKIPETYRKFSNEILNKKIVDISEIQFAKTVNEIFKASGYKYNYETKDFYIDIENINKIKNEYKEQFVDKEFNNAKEQLKNILTEKELKEFLNSKNIKLTDISNKKELEILYENNLNYARENTNDCKTYEEISKKINEIEHLSPNWKNKIKENIVNENIEKYSKEIFDYLNDNIKYTKSEIINLFIEKELKKDIKNEIAINLKLEGRNEEIFTNKIAKYKINEVKDFVEVYSNILKNIKGFEKYIELNTERFYPSFSNLLDRYSSKEEPLKNILTEKELKKFLNSTNIKLTDISDKKELEILYKNNLNYARENTNDCKTYEEISKKINEIEHLSPNWKNKIISTIVIERNNYIENVNKKVETLEKYQINNYREYLKAKLEYSKLKTKYNEQGITIPTINYMDIENKLEIMEKEIYKLSSKKIIEFEKYDIKKIVEVNKENIVDSDKIKYNSFIDAVKKYIQEGFTASKEEVSIPLKINKPNTISISESKSIVFNENETKIVKRLDHNFNSLLLNKLKENEKLKYRLIEMYNEITQKKIYIEIRTEIDGKEIVKASSKRNVFEQSFEETIKYSSLKEALSLYVKNGYSAISEEKNENGKIDKKILDLEFNRQLLKRIEQEEKIKRENQIER